MRYLSVCSGIEAASMAWNPLGFTPAAFSEIEKFPSQVLAHHYPDVPNLGDMTKFKEWDIGTIDILVGGTPCQSFSVAGLRKGLEDPRGNLALTYLGILNKFRPKWCVWENVPGVLSSNGGRDFGSFLGALVELGYGFAYRVLDAKHFGVAQRRRRVFVVGHLGGWEAAAKVLFESESLRGDIKESGEEKQEITGSIERSTAGSSKRQSFRMVAFGQYSDDDTASAMKARDYKDATDLVAYSIREDAKANTFSATELNVSTALQALRPSVQSHHAQTFVAHPMAVRRLTPTECERLQGFPDGYTDIQPNGKPTPDAPRFKALGNSMAVPVMHWIGKHIQAVNNS